MLTYRTRERLQCEIISFADGDTVKCRVHCPTCESSKVQYVRLKNIESFEVRSVDKLKAMAIAKKWTAELSGKRAELIVTQNSSDKYGRVVGDILVNGSHLTKLLVDAGDSWYV